MVSLIAPRMIDFDKFVESTRYLEPKALKAYVKLLHYYWKYARLPISESRLAGIFDLSVREFRQIKEQLLSIFSVDEDGRWCDSDLESDRERAVEIMVKEYYEAHG